jgi:hypothetical protein
MRRDGRGTRREPLYDITALRFRRMGRMGRGTNVRLKRAMMAMAVTVRTEVVVGHVLYNQLPLDHSIGFKFLIEIEIEQQVDNCSLYLTGYQYRQRLPWQ